MTTENNVPERDCRHGRLARSCETCELIQERDEARLEAKAYREVARREAANGDRNASWDVDAEKQRLIEEWKKSETKEDK